MTAFEDVLEWAASRPWWQQKALARIASGEVLDASDHEHIARSLFETPEAEPEGGWLAGLAPVADTGGQPVTLKSVSGLVGVNRLAADQEMTFAPEGLTVVFGNNGSGKSGYARVIRSMVRTRHQGDILPDVFSQAPEFQQGKVVFAVGEAERVATLGAARDSDLSRVAFYDEQCGDTYLSEETEISYRPSAIQLLDDLHVVCTGVRQAIDRWKQESSTPGPLPQVDDHGTHGMFLNNLVAATTDAEIDAATACATDIDEQLERQVDTVAALRTTDPRREKRRHADAAAALEDVANEIRTISEAVGPQAQARRDQLTAAAVAAREAAEVASRATFADEPLPDVGSSTWKSLWQAAEEYSKRAAYPRHPFPHTGDDAVCVLCQQELTENAASRLTRFHDFVTDSTVRQAEEAEKQLDGFRKHLEGMQIPPTPVVSAMGLLDQETEGFSASVENHWDQLRRRRAALLAGEQLPLTDMSEVIQRLQFAARQHLEQDAALDAEGHAQRIADAQNLEWGLREQIAMRDGRNRIEAERERLRRLGSLEKKHSGANPRSITDKVGELTRSYVTQEAQDRFTRETDRLGLERVKFTATKARQGTLLHKAAFLNARHGAQLVDVLSEGEQTALGFAGFLTEAHFDTTKSALVLDDPVSSLDHMKREVVADRLADLAEERQIVVFTHDIAFTMILRRVAGEHGVPYATRGVEHRRKIGPGFTTTAHPWTAQDASQRIETIRQKVAHLRREEAGMTEEHYLREAEDIAGSMSQTWERIVSQVLAEPLVDYKSLEVRVGKLRVVGRLTEEDVKAYDDSYKRISGWAARHDPHPELNYTSPTVGKLQEEIEVLAAWFNKVKKYQA